MIPLTLGEVAALVGGTLDAADAALAVPGPVVSDHRHVVPGALFVAVRGERVDGHDLAPEALAAGAVAVLAARPVGGPAVLVDDPVAALGRLARGVLDRLGARVVGVTGSSGKTSTKDLLAQVLEPLGPLVAPAGSLNTEVGLPLTVLTADAATRLLVLEYSARGMGHIAYLTGIAPPQVGLVLNVGSTHVGEFGSREAIAVAKGELVEALPADGVAVLNGDDPLVAAMASRTRARVVLAGQGGTCDVRASDIRVDSRARASFTLHADGGSAPVALGVHGEHHVANALSVAAAALALGMALPEVAERLSGARVVSRWRMEVTERADGVTVVNDAYNANPESVRAALKALVAMADGRRTWAVLGPMAELGAESDDAHDAIGRLAVRLDVSRLVAVGPGAARTHAGAALEGSWSDEAVLVPDLDAALELLRAELRPGDVVLVKASRSAGFERLAAALVEEGGPA